MFQKKQNKLFLAWKLHFTMIYNYFQDSLSKIWLKSVWTNRFISKHFFFLFMRIFHNQIIARERTRTPRPKTINKGKFALRCIVQKSCTCENENCIAFQMKESFRTKCNIPWMQINQSCPTFQIQLSVKQELLHTQSK